MKKRLKMAKEKVVLNERDEFVHYKLRKIDVAFIFYYKIT